MFKACEVGLKMNISLKFIKNYIIRNLKIDLIFFKLKWRLKNRNNATLPVNLFNDSLVLVGNKSYGPLTVHSSGASGEGLEIGNYVSIASGVKFILGGNHNTNTFTTFPHKYMTWGQGVEATSKGPIIVHDEVWIGTDSMILSGVTLGKGSIVAAGSVVTKSVPAYSIVGGNPAKVIKYRFDEEIISQIKDIDFNAIPWNDLVSHQELFYKELDADTVKQIKKLIIN